MSETITLKYEFENYNKSEIRRYMGIKTVNDQIEDLIDECISECRDIFRLRVCYNIYPISILNDEIDFGFITVKSKDLSKNLNGCNKAVLFAATTGIEIDRKIMAVSNLSPVKALCYNAIGADRIELLCDAFENDITKDLITHKPRFSPGYGDLSINFQKAIFDELSCSSRIGVFLSDSMQMTPSKSVTAIIGVYDDNT